MTRLRTIVIAICLAVFGGPVAAQAMGPAVASVAGAEGSGPVRPATAQTKSAASLDQTYAAREANAKGLETFEGGHSGVYIGGGAATLLIVLLILIIIL